MVPTCLGWRCITEYGDDTVPYTGELCHTVFSCTVYDFSPPAPTETGHEKAEEPPQNSASHLCKSMNHNVFMGDYVVSDGKIHFPARSL